MQVKKISRIKSEISGQMYGTGLSLSFENNDGWVKTIELSSETLRKECPCASCQQKRGDTSHAAPLSGKTSRSSLLKVIKSTSEEECNLEKIWLLGNYAVGMKWADGHDSGIYTFSFLTELAEKPGLDNA
jgi:DUF971 family protein